MPGEGPSSEAEVLARVLELCDLLDERLDAAEAELTPPSPAKLSDDSEPSEEPLDEPVEANEPVVGAQGAAELEQALEEGWRY